MFRCIMECSLVHERDSTQLNWEELRPQHLIDWANIFTVQTIMQLCEHSSYGYEDANSLWFTMAQAQGDAETPS